MLKTFGRETLNALKIMLVLLVLCVVIYPLLVWGAGQLAFNKQANGNLIRNSAGQVIGSELIGQQFTRREYFQGRPSAVGYNAAGSGASNLGPTNPQLINGNGSEITLEAGATPPPNATPVAGKPDTFYVAGSYLGTKTYAEQFREINGLATDAKLPVDIVTASGSGLDPHISVEAANLQVNRIVAARKALGNTKASITAERVKELIRDNTDGRDLLVLGEPRVNVLKLNLALDSAFGSLAQATK